MCKESSISISLMKREVCRGCARPHCNIHYSLVHVRFNRALSFWNICKDSWSPFLTRKERLLSIVLRFIRGVDFERCDDDIFEKIAHHSASNVSLEDIQACGRCIVCNPRIVGSRCTVFKYFPRMKFVNVKTCSRRVCCNMNVDVILKMSVDSEQKLRTSRTQKCSEHSTRGCSSNYIDFLQ